MKPMTILSIVIIVTALEIVGITLSLSSVKDAHMLLAVKMSLDPAVMDAPLLDQELFTLILNVAIWQDYSTIFIIKSNYNTLCCQLIMLL